MHFWWVDQTGFVLRSRDNGLCSEVHVALTIELCDETSLRTALLLMLAMQRHKTTCPCSFGHRLSYKCKLASLDLAFLYLVALVSMIARFARPISYLIIT